MVKVLLSRDLEGWGGEGGGGWGWEGDLVHGGQNKPQDDHSGFQQGRHHARTREACFHAPEV